MSAEHTAWPNTSAQTLALLLLLLAACSSAEQKACANEERIHVEMAREAGMEQRDAPELEASRQACVEQLEASKAEYSLSDEEYATYVNCRRAAQTFDDELDCQSVLTDKIIAEAEAKVDAVLDQTADEGRAALARLEPFVERGLVDAANLAQLEVDFGGSALGAYAAVMRDAVDVLDGGRVAPGTKVQIRVSPPIAGERASESDRISGPGNADLLFTDAQTGLLVARTAPVGDMLLGARARRNDFDELLAWMLEDPHARALELCTEGSAVSAPTMFNLDDARRRKIVAQLAEAGVDGRAVLITNAARLSFAQMPENPGSDPVVE